MIQTNNYYNNYFFFIILKKQNFFEIESCVVTSNFFQRKTPYKKFKNYILKNTKNHQNIFTLYLSCRGTRNRTGATPTPWARTTIILCPVTKNNYILFFQKIKASPEI